MDFAVAGFKQQTEVCLRTQELPRSVWNHLLWFLGEEEETDRTVFSYVPHQSIFSLKGKVFHSITSCFYSPSKTSLAVSLHSSSPSIQLTYSEPDSVTTVLTPFFMPRVCYLF